MSKHLVQNSSEQSDIEIVKSKPQCLDSTDIEIDVFFSCINYKDALAVSAKAPILRKFPLVPGIDGAGTVVKSNSDDFPAGSKVLVNGSGFGELRDGGFSSCLYAPESLLVACTGSLTPRNSMIFGTAGFTAALAIYQLELNGLNPGNGSVLVNGVSGGVGGVACLILKAKGYHVTAITSRIQNSDYIRSLGVDDIHTPNSLALGSKPLEKMRFVGAIDNLGGDFLSKLPAHIELFGSIACVGLVLTDKVSFSVMPLILRGVNLLGVSSANTPMPLRRKIWESLGEMDLESLVSKLVIKEIGLSEVSGSSDQILTHQNTGRFLVNLSKD